MRKAHRGNETPCLPFGVMPEPSGQVGHDKEGDSEVKYFQACQKYWNSYPKIMVAERQLPG